MAGGHRQAGGVQQEVPGNRRTRGRLRPGGRGQRPARAARGRGPRGHRRSYLETKEYIASFYLLDCASEERAQQIAADMPFADVEPVELWPVLHESAADM
jgi:hypothetical protein